MNNQPEALRLADALDAWDGKLMMPKGWREKTSTELRRLHEMNHQLIKAYLKMRNSAAGYSLYCEDSATTRRCEREYKEAEDLYRNIGVKATGESK